MAKDLPREATHGPLGVRSRAPRNIGLLPIVDVTRPLSARKSHCDTRNTTSRRSEQDRLTIAVCGYIKKCCESLPFNSCVDMIAFDAAKELPSSLVGRFEPIAGHVAATVYSGTAEIDLVAVACAA